MISSALHRIDTVVVVLLMGSVSACPVIADEAGNPGASLSPGEEEINLFEDTVEKIDSLALETASETTGEENVKADRDAFFVILDEGVDHARDGDTEEALESFSLAIAGGYESAAPYYNIAVMAEYDEEGARYKGENQNYGLVFYDRTLAVDNSYYPARYNYGVLYHELEMFDEAEAVYRDILDVSGETEKNARYNLALILRDKKQLNEAISMLEEADDPYSEPESLILLALLNEESGAASRAIRLYKKALEMDLSFEMNALAIKKISTLRSY